LCEEVNWSIEEWTMGHMEGYECTRCRATVDAMTVPRGWLVRGFDDYPPKLGIGRRQATCPNCVPHLPRTEIDSMTALYDGTVVISAGDDFASAFKPSGRIMLEHYGADPELKRTPRFDQAAMAIEIKR